MTGSETRSFAGSRFFLPFFLRRLPPECWSRPKPSMSVTVVTTGWRFFGRTTPCLLCFDGSMTTSTASRQCERQSSRGDASNGGQRATPDVARLNMNNWRNDVPRTSEDRRTVQPSKRPKLRSCCMINVAAVAFSKGKRWSLAGRKDKHFENAHGGSCNEGETPSECVVREIHEEFGGSIHIEPNNLKVLGVIDTGEVRLTLFAYPLLQELFEVDLCDQQSSFSMVEVATMRNIGKPCPSAARGELGWGSGPARSARMRAMYGFRNFNPLL